MGFLSAKSPLKSTVLFGVFSALRSGISLLLLPIFLNYLNPEDYGILSLVIVYSSIVAIVGSLGLKSALYTFYFDFDKKELLKKYLGNLFSLLLFSFIVITGIHLVLGNQIYEFIFVSNKVAFYHYGLIALLSTFFGMLNNLYFIFLKNEVNLKVYFLYSASIIILTAFFQIVLITQFDLKVYGMLLGTLIPNVIVFLVISFSNTYLFTFKLKKKLLYPSLNYSLKLLPFLFVFTFENQIDKYLIELNLGLKQVGLYALLIKLFGLLLIAINALDDGLRPFMYRDLKDGKATVNTYFNLYIGFGVLILVFINALGYNLDLFFKNPEYLVISDYFFWGSVAFLLVIPVRYYGLLLVYYKASFKLSLITTIKVVVMVLLMLFLIPKYQLYGALYALSISYLLNGILFALILKKRVVLFPNGKTLIFVLLFVVASYFVHSNIEAFSKRMISVLYMVILIAVFLVIYFKEGYLMLKTKL